MLLLLLLAWLNLNQAKEPILKSLQYYVNKNTKMLPVLKMHSGDKLTISFDIEAPHEPSFNIKFKFCDAQWEPYDNLLLEGIGENVQYNINVEKLPLTTEGAEYFVSEKFPNRNVKFNNSGKWMFFITDSFDEDIIYDWGKFYVVENSVNLNLDIQDWRREGMISSNNANDRVLNFKTKFAISDSLEPFRIDHIEIIKNWEIDYPKILEKDSFSRNRIYEWDGSNNFEFGILDLEPGNEYRQVNLNDRNKFEFPITRANFEGIEYSRFYKLGSKDLNGSFNLMNRKNEYSDYLIATFEFSPPQRINEDVFIVGAFTNWDVLPWFKMEVEEELYSISLELKRGIYDYQYVTGTIENDKVINIDWRTFEGNFWETENVYSVFLYYKSPNKGEYDKIIGYKQIVR